MLSSFCAFALLIGICAPDVSRAETYTDPVGFITLTAVGTNGISGKALSFWGLGLTQVVTNRGIITGIDGTKLTLNSPMIDGGFNSGPLGPLFFIEIVSGANAGLIDDIVSNSTVSVFTASDLSGLINQGDKYKIYPHWTIAKLFGSSNEAGLLGGSTVDSADNIIIPNPNTQTSSRYFWFTGKGGPAWRMVGGGTTDQSLRPINLDQGFIVQKETGTNINLKLVGAVKLGTTIVPLGGTNNFVGNVYATSTIVLSNSGLVSSGLQGGTTVDIADNVLIHNDNDGSYARYFYFTGKGGPAWRLVGGGATDRGGTQLPLGGSILIQMAPGHNGFNWTIPAPY
jgi:uncharacterized protein (TIGR02597 family)